jgi:LPS export ABC transporter protein LptC
MSKKMQLIRPTQLSIQLLLALMLLITVGSCRQRDQATKQLAEDTAAAKDITENLTLANITLQQANDKGQTLWQVKATEATYSPDRKTAEVRNPDGELYQDGKPVFRVRAERGVVEQNGESVRLSGRIVATDIRSGAVLKGDELEWQPRRDTLIVRNQLVGTHPQIQISAAEARVYSRKQQMELLGPVVVVTRDPSLRLQAQHLLWQVAQQKIISDRPTQIQRLSGKQVTSQAQSDRADVDLKAKTVNLIQNANLQLQDPPLQVSGNALLWNLKDETVIASQPVTIQHRQQQVTVTADRGRMNLQQKLVYLTQNVQAVGQANNAQLKSDSLSWNVSTQEVVADGNVLYTQADPVMNVRGPRAVGKLRNRTIVLSGGRVETQIIPEQVNRN